MMDAIWIQENGFFNFSPHFLFTPLPCLILFPSFLILVLSLKVIIGSIINYDDTEDVRGK